MPNLASMDIELINTSENKLQEPDPHMVLFQEGSQETFSERDKAPRAELTQWDLRMLLFSRIASLGYLFNICVSGQT